MKSSSTPSSLLLSSLALTLLLGLVLCSMELTALEQKISTLQAGNQQLKLAATSVPPKPDTFDSSSWHTYTYAFPYDTHGFTLKYPDTWEPDPEHGNFPVPKDFLASRTDARFFQPIDWGSDDNTSVLSYYQSHDDWYLGQQGVGPRQLTQITLTDGQRAFFVLNSGSEFVYYLNIPGNHVVKLALPIAGPTYGQADMTEGFQVINTAQVF